MPIHNRIADFADDLTEWRRDLHAHPELAFQEHRTSDFVAGKLASWGIEVTRGIAGTGLVGTLRNGQSSRAIGIRADMDALPIEEANTFAHRSQNPGRMHACGHDGHTTMLLGAARYLAETRNFDGTVNFIFQPAEEDGGGGEVMVREGLFDRFPCDQVFGAHNDFTIPVGQMTAVAGIVCANADEFAITVHGRGGHAARPQRAIDPVMVGASIVVALQSIVARRVDPLDSAVISTCVFNAGSAGNVIPMEAVLRGTVRTLKPATRGDMERILREVVAGIAAAHGATADVDYHRGYPSVVNDPAATERAALAAARLLGDTRVIRDRLPGMGGEDFAYMSQAVPGCFVRIGQVDGDRGAVSVHHPSYDFNDDILPIGASFWSTLVEQELPREEVEQELART
jgi:amidohydrolase